MSDKTFILSASGLKNIVSLKNDPEIIRENDFDVNNLDKTDFIFNFGEYKVRMHTFLAEFISPRVSKLHQADPTINIINLFNTSNNENNKTKEIFDLELIKTFINISIGCEITINQAKIEKLLFLSIILDNSNLYEEMNKVYSICNDDDHNKIDQYLEYLIFYDEQSQNDQYTKKYNDKIIDFVSSHFYLIEETKLLKLPKNVLYLIISNDNLKLNNEDSLLDFIEKLFSNDEEEDFKILFYEQIELICLSESKFRTIIENIDYNKISCHLWYKIKECLYCDYQIRKSKSNQNRYSNENFHNKKENQIQIQSKCKTISFDNDSNHRFNGIICNLYKSQNPNYDEKIVKITASSINGSNYQPKNVIDYENKNSAFSSNSEKNSWIKFDFNERKINPSAYSLRSNNWGGVYHFHPQNWVIEGSNDDAQWTVLDTHTNDHSIDDQSKSNTFFIQNKNNIFYRYLKLRQTGSNTHNNDTLIISAIEFFGTIQES